ncbi:MAG: 3-isopropylmalate dehydratase small subunit [Planctomycetes bacterium]|jgi:3-isopropylmalate/(R)-2-methylmalate dehydratase small subunit|nr:3-isopropylmalate dehydratase small subunit [Planctomycetota bacterium]MBL6909482.1 3-isopropylmalate dehydratase small subunit [Pirellulales bacterium]OUV74927.1 MAG: 3-isopropylmalate dehydratase small subunit [Planctomycetaceae bacterium TMED138]RZO63100.1 MAG: 3-isopropylmalate dehydratase small subunit [Phycisphaeraceae bacterium]HAO73065.1 3-isopropylmalate dehydratase small subunit [Planctomycetaceae bacterium]|tara:strand:+ start:111 stop:734 length:624 start_codon:yes stop_codon:yes gene_type:complete
MQSFTKHSGVVAAMDRSNVDTDQIIPKQFLKRIERTGFGQFLFNDWRFLSDGTPDPSFELNRPEAEGATILLARRNFGCGSSREHAPWALADYGFRCVIAPTFADIFYSNCFSNSILPIRLLEEDVEQLFELAKAATASNTGKYELNIDLNECTLFDDDSFQRSFEVEPFRRRCLLEGLDNISLSLKHTDEISAWEKAHGLPSVVSG